jgi:DNA polymerase I-like protein with 3'-5' exonuclease and polymerase domains
MMSAYRSSDPYLKFAEMAGAVPPGATKDSHPRERSMYKIVVLGTQFSMTEMGLRRALNCSPALARQLMRQHKEIFPQYWEWVDRVTTCAQLGGSLSATLGWQRDMLQCRFTSQSNFPAQANGAEMMRVASVLAMEAGLEVCCPIHDAFLIESSLEEIDQAVARMQACMVEASRIILSDFELRSDAEIIRYPDTYHVDADQASVWDIVTPFIERLTPISIDRGGVSDMVPPSNII